jgi:predicted metal-dependent hydrolase
LFLLSFLARCLLNTPPNVKKIRKFFRLISSNEPADTETIQIDSHKMPIVYRRHARARNYVLRLHWNKTVVVTMPKNGSKKFAQEFVNSRKPWLERQWKVLEARKIPPQVLKPGMEILFRGRPVTLAVAKQGRDWQVNFGSQAVELPGQEDNLRPFVEAHMFELAEKELVERTMELARAHRAQVARVVIRNQKSRWGSCSYNGTISLNWRLIQLPAQVRDYIIVHELMHLRELNHSKRFWNHVARACPNYQGAEDWLKQNSGLVGF